MKVLHIVASPRGAGSNTLAVSRAFFEELAVSHPDVEVETLDLHGDGLPSMNPHVIGHEAHAFDMGMKFAVMYGHSTPRTEDPAWTEIAALVEQFKGADRYVVSAPMWNWNVPFSLKYYLDCIIQPGLTLAVDEGGDYVGLVTDKKLAFITARGGDYSEGSPLAPMNFQEPHMNLCFGAMGVRDITWIVAQPCDLGPADVAVKRASEQARELASSGWAG